MKMEPQNCNGSDLSLDKLLESRLKTIRRKKAIRSLLLRLLLTASIVYLLFGVVGGVGFVKGESMKPALFSGDIVLFFRLPSDYDHGDIVLLKENDNYIKRVAALPGQTVDIDRNTHQLLVDGIPAEDDYAWGSTFCKTGCSFPLTLGQDEYFVLGDSRENSVDSRNFGPVHREQLLGRIIALLRFEGGRS